MFKDLPLKRIYRSYGEDSISDMINPVLSHAVSYKRSVGFFSASSLKITSNGLNQLIRNRNNCGLDTNKSFIQFIASPTISSSDKEAIELGYKTRNDVVKSSFINESENGLRDNYERIFIFNSWESIGEPYVNDDIEEFDSLWNGTNEFNDVYSFPDAIRNSIIKVRKEKANGKNELKPYDYQLEAINAWKENGNKGFFVMATGTGKTLTSLFALREALNVEPLFTVIAVPYKHLVAQWSEDVEKVFPDVTLMKVSSEFPGWDSRLKNFLMLNKFEIEKKSIIIVTTIKSFYGEKFASAFAHNRLKTCLIIDEAHNFLNKIYEAKYFIDYDYKIGLSATPVFGTDSKKTYDLLNFFGGEVYSLPIEKAIGKYLVNYNYHPIFVETTDNDEKMFKYFTKKIMSCMKDGVIIDEEEYTKAYRGRLRCISMAENKINNLESIITDIDAKDHFIVYCSDGKIDNDSFVSVRHLNLVTNKLIELGYDPSQFTASENMDTRMKLINAFNKGDIHTLVAIRCLDEGVNIPSITKALILSSNNNYREFVQRRGRILRKYNGKKIADIYDIIVLPSHDCIDIAKIEFRRFNEYMKVAKNKNIVEPILNRYLDDYGLSYDDIQFDNEYLTGGEFDD